MTPEQAVKDLVAAGAAFDRTPGGIPAPVGYFRRLGPQAWFWWEAGGATEFHGHLIEADDAKVLYGGRAVQFSLRGAFAGYLTAVPEAIDDESQAASALRTISAWQRQFDQDENLRAFVLQQARYRQGKD